ncbi:CRP-like cAMP-binding protein [Algoriphagus sp. 4150]|uniref:Crp/Fnr family transcriptional regulator n=1 Tax=Algoriphagus sp. 4150 TaxID=2817756 RepID=UPI00285C438E|nr:hypothetical protein [Algoriphagus sp. 4150]MDR7128107.1 CRP-like cAMP-binding protein [Algoriphagus sp. 4150]
MESEFLNQLIKDFDQILKLPRETYEWVSPYLKEVRLKRGTIIKKSGTADKASRYLLEGFAGSFTPNGEKLMLVKIFQASDIVFDESSFRAGIPGPTMLKAISDVVFMEFPKEAEAMLLGRHAELVLLAHKVIHRIAERNATVHHISKLGLRRGYQILMDEFPRLESEITNADLASFFDVSTRTVERWKHDLKMNSHE